MTCRFAGLMSCAVVTALLGHTVAVRAGQSQSPAPAPLVSQASLSALMPSPDGWTKETQKTDQVTLSSTCDYTFAAVTYAKGAMRVKITLADSGSAQESLLVLAPMVILLPDDYTGTITPATVVTRLKIAESPAAERWDDDKHDGEITVLVGGRFVASLEGSHVDRLETLRVILRQIDLKKVADLK